MNSTYARQELYDYMKLSDAQNQTDFETTLLIEQPESKSESLPIIPKFYELFIYIDHDSSELKDLYLNSVHKHNKIVDDYLTAISKNETNMEKYCFNAGFDLFCPEDTESIGAQKVVLDHKIISCMKMKNIYVSYYLYSRSSTPMKTPLRLANSVGVIDSGYRGHIKAVFDNKNDYDFMEYNIEFGSRLAQLCPPNLEYPMKIYIVDDIQSLGITDRGDGGFGSTGN
jgi:dUTP pyrophosphatase